MAELFAYTDGACSGNPGPGGWGVVLEAGDDGTLIKARDLGGGEALTTNNRMEMMAAIVALEALERPSAITVVTDSTYLKDGITRWIHGWKKNGWKTAAKKPVKNTDLWQRLDAAQIVASRTLPDGLMHEEQRPSHVGMGGDDLLKVCHLLLAEAGLHVALPVDSRRQALTQGRRPLGIGVPQRVDLRELLRHTGWELHRHVLGVER